MTHKSMRRGAVAGAAALAVVVAGCGGSDKPGYCTARSNLEQSVKGLSDLKVLEQGGLGALPDQFRKIEQQAKDLVAQAKSDFPAETSAIESSVNALVAAVKGLPDKAQPQQLAPLVADASAAVNALDRFLSKTEQECK